VSGDINVYKVGSLYQFFFFRHQFNLVRGLVLPSSGFSPLLFAAAGDRTVVLHYQVQRQSPLNQLTIGIIALVL
jgi:hypothetical protein